MLSVSAVETKLIPTDGAAGDTFGVSVAICGEYAVVGANHHFGQTHIGAAYVFDLATGSQLHRLAASDRPPGDAEVGFGNGVACEDNIAIIGATEADVLAHDSGAAYVYDVTTGDALAKLFADDGTAEDDFGLTVAVSGNTAIVGAQWHASSRGAAYLFDVTTGNQLSQIRASDAQPGDFFGRVAIDGNVAMIGTKRGPVYVYDVSDPTAPIELTKVPSPNNQPGDAFGIHILISDDLAVVSAMNADASAGAVHLFDVSDPASPVQLARVTAPDRAPTDNFGSGIAIDGDLLVVGAFGVDGAATNSGAVYGFDVSNPSLPTLVLELTASDAAEGDRFGTAVGIAGRNLVVGAAEKDDVGVLSGAAYLYGLNTTPEITDDGYSVDEDKLLLVSALGVLENDSDPDGDSLTAVKETNPAHGTLEFNDDGSFIYKPAPDFHGTDTFTYRAFDGVDYSETAATVTITVKSVVDALVDIKPGSDPNSINLDSNGVLAVAILSTQTEKGEPEDFDATSLSAVDLDLFQFGDSREGYGRVGAIRSAVEDVDGDGDLDLVLHFSMEEIREAGALAADTVDAVLTAEFGGGALGVDLTGLDAINIVPRSNGKSKKDK